VVGPHWLRRHHNIDSTPGAVLRQAQVQDVSYRRVNSRAPALSGPPGALVRLRRTDKYLYSSGLANWIASKKSTAVRGEGSPQATHAVGSPPPRAQAEPARRQECSAAVSGTALAVCERSGRDVLPRLSKSLRLFVNVM